LTEHYHSLQILRGIAAWLVVFYHYMQIVHGFQADSWLGDFFSSHGMLGVDLFFTLSGFIMCRCIETKAYRPFEFFIRRLFRVTPAYWAYTFLALLLIHTVNEGFFKGEYTPLSLMASLFYFSTDSPAGLGCFPTLTVGWTLNYEMLFYTILSLSIAFGQKKAVFLCVAVLALAPFLAPTTEACYCIWKRGDILALFVIGLLIGKMVPTVGKLVSKTRAISCIGLFVSLTFLLPKTGETLKAKLLFCALSLLFFLLMEKYVKEELKLMRVLKAIGDFSFSTYLCHVPIISLFHIFLYPSWGIQNEASFILAMSLSTLVASYASYHLLERNKSLLNLRLIVLRKLSA